VHAFRLRRVPLIAKWWRGSWGISDSLLSLALVFYFFLTLSLRLFWCWLCWLPLSHLDRKSKLGTCQFLGFSLVSSPLASNPVLLSPWLRQSMLPPLVAAHNFFGWSLPWEILAYSSLKCPCFVTARVPLV
jgi:hypothetical protein